MNELELRRAICEIGHRVWLREFVASNDGNISVRLDEDRILCTPTMVSKGFMNPEDLAVVDWQGNQLSGVLPRTSEVKAHIEFMRHRPDVKAVLHAHPPHATAFCVARMVLPRNVLPEIELFFDQIPMVPYATPGTQEFADLIIPHMKRADAFLLSSHGALTVGETVAECYYRMEMIDQYCRILILAKQLCGGWEFIDESGVEELRRIRERLTRTAPKL